MEELRYAVTADNYRQLSTLLSSYAELVNVPIDDTDTTLLHLAANAMPAVLELLLKHQADVNRQNEDGITPLHVAAMWGNSAAVRLLLDYGADPFITDDDDMTPLDHAMSEGHTSCIQDLKGDVGGSPEGGGGATIDVLDMSMAEAFVSMMTNDLTLVTQLDDIESSDLLATPTGTLSPATPIACDQHVSTATPFATTPTNPATPSGISPATPIARYQHANAVTLSTVVTPINLAVSPETPSYATPTTTPANHDAEGSPALDISSSQNHSHHQKVNHFHNPRRELFPQSNATDSSGVKLDLSVLNLTDDDYLGDTILLTDAELGCQVQDKHNLMSDARKAPEKPAANGEDQVTSPNTFTQQDTTVIPSWIKKLTNEELKRKLVSLGEHPGPINDMTRSAYQLYLVKLQDGVQPAGNKGYKGYKYELALVLNGTVAIPDLTSLEQLVFNSFRKPVAPLTPSTSLSSTPSAATTPGRTRPGKTPRSQRKPTKDHFNYLLLDPTLLDSINCAHGGLERFRRFVEAVFYVGKGKNSRSMQHLKDAKEFSAKQTKVSAKLSRILSIWSCDRGVVSLQLFHNTTAEEAFTREACLIEAIGLDVLTNVQRGHVYGEVCGWRMGKRRQMGVHLLHKAFQTYSIDPPQEILRHDL